MPINAEKYNPLPHLTSLNGYPIINIIGFKVYYTDWEIISSKDVDWKDLPKQEVQNVVLYFAKKSNNGKHCRYLMSGKDYYFKGLEGFGYSFNDETYVKGDVIYGKYTTLENYNKLFDLAVKDVDF